ncbi:MAG: hypothetical protein KC777_13520 [Cyanobacteria bacterium HKST-UBA02]|nr:hypothetical protein [Cyanobacteria bacterium HKST-UBA02]
MADRATEAQAQTGHGQGNNLEHAVSEGWGKFTGFLKRGAHKAGDLIESGVESAQQIDTRELAEKGKGVASEGLNVIRGESGTKADGVSDEIVKWVPQAQILRRGAEALKQSGAERKVLGDGKGEVTARPFIEAGTDAVPNLITVPGVGGVGNQVLEQTGIKKKAAGTIMDMVRKSEGESGVVASGNTPELGGVTIIDPNAGTINNAGRKLRGFLRGITGGDQRVKK